MIKRWFVIRMWNGRVVMTKEPVDHGAFPDTILYGPITVMQAMAKVQEMT